MDKFLGFKTEEILTCLLLFAIVVFLLYHLIDTCSCCYIDGFSVSGKKRNKHKLKSEDIFIPSTKVELQTAVDLWTINQDKAIVAYGKINTWDTSEITDMSYLFHQKHKFNEDISGWDVSSVTDMSYMFYEAKAFNKPLNKWNVSSVTDMSEMFRGAEAFDQDLSGWDVSSVTEMYGMFAEAETFDRDISRWDVSSVTNISYMFYYAKKFNADISGWDVSSVTDMSVMFYSAETFDQDISGWDVSSVTDMRSMFNITIAFDQDLNCWEVDIASVKTDYMFTNSNMEYDNPIINGCWNKESDNYIGCHTYCNSPAPPKHLINH